MEGQPFAGWRETQGSLLRATPVPVLPDIHRGSKRRARNVFDSVLFHLDGWFQLPPPRTKQYWTSDSTRAVSLQAEGLSWVSCSWPCSCCHLREKCFRQEKRRGNTLKACWCWSRELESLLMDILLGRDLSCACAQTPELHLSGLQCSPEMQWCISRTPNHPPQHSDFLDFSSCPLLWSE